MKNNKRRVRLVTARTAGAFGCLILIAGVFLGGYLLYQQLRGLLASRRALPGGQVVATQNVPVTRGSVAEVLTVYGALEPEHEASLGFLVARGEVVSVPVEAGQTVRKGQVLVELDEAALERTLAEARAALLEAQSKVDDLTIAGDATQRLKLEVDLLNARTALDKARTDLASFEAGKDTPQTKRQTAAASLADAQEALAALRDSETRREQIERLQWIYNVAEVKHGPMVLITNPSEKDRDTEWLLRLDMLEKHDALDKAKLQYEIDLRAAEQKVETARRALQALDREIAAGSQAIELRKRQVAVAVAENQVRQVEASLEALGKTEVSEALVRAQADALKLEWKVADAEAALAESKLVAPFDGVIDTVTVEPDDVIASSTAVVTMFDPNSLIGVAQISDVDIGRVRAGQQVQLAMEALRGQQALTARLGDIPLFGTYQDGLTYFDVPLMMQGRLTGLKAGMTLNVSIPLDRKDNVLVVPSAGLRYDERGTYVLVVSGGAEERRTVRVGLNDGTYAEILEGLTEGEIVRVPLRSPSNVGRLGG